MNRMPSTPDDGRPTTPEEAVRAAAARWLAAHPQVRVTEHDLLKSLKHLVTKLFRRTTQTGRRDALDDLGDAVLAAAGLTRVGFSPARTFSWTEPIDGSFGRGFTAVADVLCATAATVQASKNRVTRHALALSTVEPGAVAVTRDQIDGRVVSLLTDTLLAALTERDELARVAELDHVSSIADEALLGRAAALVLAKTRDDLGRRGAPPAATPEQVSAVVERLVALHDRRLRSALLRWSRTAADADDAAQETWRRIIVTLGRRPDTQVTFGYLLTTGRKCLGTPRSGPKHVVPVDDELLARRSTGEDPTVTTPAMAAVRTGVEVAVAELWTLPDRCDEANHAATPEQRLGLPCGHRTCTERRLAALVLPLGLFGTLRPGPFARLCLDPASRKEITTALVGEARAAGIDEVGARRVANLAVRGLRAALTSGKERGWGDET